MTIDEYQKAVLTTALYKDDDQAFLCSVTGMQGELGEIMEALKKYTREDDEKAGMSPIDAYFKFKTATTLELGDLLWYIALYAHLWNISLGDVLDSNISKLSSRAQRGVLHGSGNHR